MISCMSNPEITIFEKLDSTNLEALRVAKFVSGPSWILTYNQYNGVGRYGKDWFSCSKNFSASLIFFPDGSNLQFAQRSFSSALSVRDTLINFKVPSEIISFKWPNDVLLNGKKLAGILLQTTKVSPARSALIIGIGVNLVNVEQMEMRSQSLFEASSLSEYAEPPNPREFLNNLIKNFSYWENIFQRWF